MYDITQTTQIDYKPSDEFKFLVITPYRDLDHSDLSPLAHKMVDTWIAVQGKRLDRDVWVGCFYNHFDALLFQTEFGGDYTVR